MKNLFKSILCAMLTAALFAPSVFADEVDFSTIEYSYYNKCANLEYGNMEDYGSVDEFLDAASLIEAENYLGELNEFTFRWYAYILDEYFESYIATHPDAMEFEYYQEYHPELVDLYKDAFFKYVRKDAYSYFGINGSIYVYGNSCEDANNNDTQIFSRGLYSSLVFGDRYLPEISTGYVLPVGYEVPAEEAEYYGPGRISVEKDHITYEEEGIVRLTSTVSRNNPRSITITRTLTNLSSSDNIHYALSTSNDTSFGDNDYVAIVKKGENSLRFIQDSESEKFFGLTLDANFSPNPSTRFVGYYRNAYEDFLFGESSTDAVYQKDSIDTGFSASWDGYIGLGESLSFTETYSLGDFLPSHTISYRDNSAGIFMDQHFVEDTELEIFYSPYVSSTPGRAYAWNTQPDGGGTTYHTGEVIPAPSADLTLYPVEIDADIIIDQRHENDRVFSFKINNADAFKSNFLEDLSSSGSSIRIDFSPLFEDDYDLILAIEEAISAVRGGDFAINDMLYSIEASKSYYTPSEALVSTPISTVSIPLEITSLLTFGDTAALSPNIARTFVLYKYTKAGDLVEVPTTYNPSTATIDFSINEFSTEANEIYYVFTWSDEGSEPEIIPGTDVPNTGHYTASSSVQKSTSLAIILASSAAILASVFTFITLSKFRR